MVYGVDSVGFGVDLRIPGADIQIVHYVVGNRIPEQFGDVGWV